MPRRMQFISAALVACMCATTLAVTGAVASAQGTVPQISVPGVSPAFNAVVTRARALANNGDGKEARTLLDSLVTVSPRSSNAMAEALYWRALLSEDATAAELDWKLIVVDVPFSPRASDALLRLSELDLLRNNQQLARQHVQQLLSDDPSSPLRPRALMILARSYFDDRDAPRGCGVLTVVRREAPLSAVEVRLQADEMQQQCRNVAEIVMGSAPAPAPTTATRVTASVPATTATQAVPPPTVAQKAETGSLATQTAVLPPTSKVAAQAARRDSIARATSIRDSISRVASQRKADSVARAVERAAERVVAQQKADSVRRDSVSRAGLLAAAAQRMAANARRDSIALDSMGRDRAARSTATAAATTAAATTAATTAAATAATGRAATNPATTAARASAAGRNTTSPQPRAREILVFNADSARGDSLARDAAAIEARILGAAGERDSLKRETARRESERREAARQAAAKAGRFSVQIAAYQNKADADALVKRLAASDMSARTVGTKKPFRVQVGRYATRAAASAALAELKRNGQKSAFVVEAGK